MILHNRSMIVLLVIGFIFAQAAGLAAQTPSSGFRNVRARADAAFDAAEWTVAADGYRQLVAADAGDGRSWFRLGQALQTLGEMQAAVDAFQGVLDNDPAGAFARQSLLLMARSLAALGRPTDALARLEQFARPGPNRAAVRALESAAELAALRDTERYTAVVDQLTPCRSREHRRFDFWIGSWEVYLPGGQLAGRNVIEPVLGGCGLHESWINTAGSEGRSYNFYDAATGRWHQTWIDDNGAPLYLEGVLENGNMVLGDGSNRVTWTPLPNGYVRQHWETTADGGASWTTVFDGEYRPDPAHRMGGLP